MIYPVKEHPLTMCTFCFRSRLTKLALRGPRRCCLLRKTVPLVPLKFPISLVSHQILYLPYSNHVVNIFPTSSSPLSCIRFIRIKSTWHTRAHQCACLQCQPLAQYTSETTSPQLFSHKRKSFLRFFHSVTLAPLTSPTLDLNPCKRYPPGSETLYLSLGWAGRRSNRNN